MTQRPWLRWLLGLFRYGLCAVAIVYLYFNVTWYDRIALTDGTRPVLQRELAGGYEIRRDDGRVEVVPPDAVRRVGEDHLPDIEYGIVSVTRTMRLGYAALALLLFVPVPLLSAQRLVWMLAIQEVRLTWWQAVKLTLAGNFFNFALPGTTGGDLVKAWYVSLYTHQKTEAITTVFLDRMIGLLGLVSLASVMFLISARTLEWDAHVFRSIAGGLAVIWCGLAVAASIVFSSRLRGRFGLRDFLLRLPAGEHLLRIGRATVALRRHVPLLALCLLLTLTLQVLVVFSAFVMSKSLAMGGGIALYFVCVPIGFMIAAIPIAPPQGFGVMEFIYVEFFTRGGLNAASQAFALALAVRLIQLFWALPGVLVPLLGAHLPRRDELEEFEHLPAEATDESVSSASGIGPAESSSSPQAQGAAQ